MPINKLNLPSQILKPEDEERYIVKQTGDFRV